MNTQEQIPDEIKTILENTPKITEEMLSRLDRASRVTREELADATKTIRRFACENDEGVSIVGAYGILLARQEAMNSAVERLRVLEKYLRFLCDNLIDKKTACHAASLAVCDEALAALDKVDACSKP